MEVKAATSALGFGQERSSRDRSAATVIASADTRVPVFARQVRFAGLVTIFSALYAAGALLPFWFIESPAAGVAFFPPAGLTVSVLLLAPRRTWPIWLAVTAATEIAVDVTHGQTARLALCFAVANTLEPLVGAVMIRRTRGRSYELRRTLVAFVACGVLLAPAVGAAIGAAGSAGVSDAGTFISVAGKWWLGDALGVLIIASCIMAWSQRSPFDVRATAWLTCGVAAMAAAMTIVPAVLWQQPVLFAILPVLTLAAFIGGTRGVATAGVAVAFAADWATITGRAGRLLPAAISDEQLVLVQIFLALTVFTALMLAVEIAERRRGEHAAREAVAARARAERTTIEIAEAERRSIASETHDIVGHGLNVMLIQAGAIRRTLDTEPELAKELLASLEAVGRTACDDLELALAVIQPHSGVRPSRGLADVPELVAAVSAGGTVVDLDLDMDLGSRDVSQLVEWSAYRILQEAMTNVTKHAPGARVTVVVGIVKDDLLLSVVDDGVGLQPPDRHADGRGLIGMRERANALGGHIEAGPESRGFAIRARLPLRPALA